MGNIVQYEHHGEKVWVDEDYVGQHRDFCLCYKCDLFHPGTEANCYIAQELFELDKKHNLVTPMWECPVFENKE